MMIIPDSPKGYYDQNNQPNTAHVMVVTWGCRIGAGFMGRMIIITIIEIMITIIEIIVVIIEKKMICEFDPHKVGNKNHGNKFSGKFRSARFSEPSVIPEPHLLVKDFPVRR